MSKIILTDARSFPEIWATLSEDERDNLSLELFKKKCCRTRQAIFYWAKGERAPINQLVRDTVAQIVGKMLGAKVFPQTLFPR